MTMLGAGLAAVIGVSLGLLGGGGSILAVPVFVYVLGFGVKEAVALSLLMVGVVSLIGALRHWRAGRVNLRVAAVFGGVAMVGTYLGARLAALVSAEMQLALFAVVMLVAAFSMLRGGAPAPGAGASNGTEQNALSDMPFLLIALEGMGIGVLTGLVGVGGGFLIVPALVVLGKVGMKQAVGTSLLVISMKSAAGFLGYLGQIQVPWAFLVPFTGLAVAGILLGAHLVSHVPQMALQRSFAVFLILMGGLVLYQNRGVLNTPGGAAVEAQPATHR